MLPLYTNVLMVFEIRSQEGNIGDETYTVSVITNTENGFRWKFDMDQA